MNNWSNRISSRLMYKCHQHISNLQRTISPPSTTATSLSPISSSIPKPLDGNSSVPSFLSPPLRSHNSNSNKSSEPVNTGRADTRVYHQRNNISQSIPKPHFLPSSTNPITCNDKPQSRSLMLLEVDRMLAAYQPSSFPTSGP